MNEVCGKIVKLGNKCAAKKGDKCGNGRRKGVCQEAAVGVRHKIFAEHYVYLG